MKKVFVYSCALGLMFSFASCKSKQSAYKSAYEQAKEVSTSQAVEEIEAEPVMTTPTAKHSGAAVQVERVYAVNSSDENNLKEYNVIVGSFINKTNATALMNEMREKGYNAFLALNDRDMYRVIVASYPDKGEAVEERDRIKSKYTPRFQDAWILQQAK